MRFALVAGALVLGATVSEGRSIAPSPSKRATERIEFTTPTRNLKRARQESGWNPAAEGDDGSPHQDSMDPSAYHSKTPNGATKNAHKAPKMHRESAATDAAFRTALPGPLASTLDPVADPLVQKLPQEIQYQIIPVKSGNSSSSDSPSSDERAYIITPVPAAESTLAAVAPVDVQDTLPDGAVAGSSALTGIVAHLQSKQESQPAMALLRAIEKYRLAVADDGLQVDLADGQARSAVLPAPKKLAKAVLDGSSSAHTPLSPASDSAASTGDALLDNTSIVDASAPLANTIDPNAGSSDSDSHEAASDE
ncbi:hypothetical protein PTTG_09915 [Puccinia triticina 1-1 BBBD Race 1]|uniref:Secreted protein n=2 Tax=Puccinia triticina TaxID=208348 RepID=A0A0C4DFJ2_PUCT1|nr:uncharacterized protein PtA15_10A216 [Puccinia triticina]OAV96008.1 hypothetical protein PTTG_09915 [Puccinia triticina 1-1 BBBD Race 1]WAQ88797.1 hypothetical protein PtA15_10A216 [Puccinia triticina]WAR58859.1 hypothetical protein PtB15_10B198 [Puccinia triticina]